MAPAGQERALLEGRFTASWSLSLSRTLKRVFDIDMQHCPKLRRRGAEDHCGDPGATGDREDLEHLELQPLGRTDAQRIEGAFWPIFCNSSSSSTAPTAATTAAAARVPSARSNTALSGLKRDT